MDNETLDRQTANDDTPTAGSDTNTNEHMQRTLDEILAQLRIIAGLRRHRDFSLCRLIGAVTQLLVIGVLFWAIVGMTEMTDLHPFYEASIKLQGAVLLQLLALTFFILDRQDR